MRLFFLFIFLFSMLQAEDKKQELTIGLGAYMQTQPYKDVATIVVPSPVIFFDNSLFYIRWSRAGLYFLGNKKGNFAWGLSLTAQPRPFGYKPSDSPALNGLDEKETTVEGGLALSAKLNDTYIELMLLTDLLDRHDSWLFKTEIGDKYSLGELNFYPSIIFSYQSQNFMQYYYGITTKEATRTTYSPYRVDAGFQIGAQTYISYPLTQELSVLLNLRADRLPSSAQKSPIVEQNYIFSGLASLIYRFEY